MKRIVRFLATSLVVFLLAGTVVALGPVAQDLTASDSIFALSSHDTIEIDGNSNFNTTAASEGWAGNGSSVNPYIIEDHKIDAEGGYHAIDVRNTTVHFQIRNCSIGNITTSMNGADINRAGAIHFVNCSNIFVSNITIQNSNIGVRITGSENISLDRLYHSTSVGGIFIRDSGPDIEIKNCIINNPVSGIALSFTHNFTLFNNELNLAQTGIITYFCQDGSMDLNSVDDSSSRAFDIRNSNDLMISNSTLENNVQGIFIEECYDLIIRENSVLTTNSLITCSSGLEIWNCRDIDIDGLEVTGAQVGIKISYGFDIYAYGINTDGCYTGVYLQYSDNYTMELSNFRAGSYGVQTYILGNSSFENIDIINPLLVGVNHIFSLVDSEMTDISITGNFHTGMFCGHSHRNIFDKISINSADLGMKFYYSSGNKIWNSEVQTQTGEAVSLEHSVSNRFAHNTLRSGDQYTAILINDGSYFNEFYSNHLYNGGLSFPTDGPLFPDTALYSTQYVEISNTYEGRFILYLVNDDLEGNTLSTSYGQIFMIKTANAGLSTQTLIGVDIGMTLIECSNIDIYNSRFQYCYTSNVLIHNSDDIWFKDCQISGAQKVGMSIQESEEILISDGQVFDCRDGIKASWSDNVTIRASEFERIALTSIDLEYCLGVDISENTFKDANLGIRFQNIDSSSINISVFLEMDRSILVENSRDIFVSWNDMSQIDDYGISLIEVDDSSITDNTISDAEFAISCTDGTNNNFFNNEIEKVEYGIYLIDTTQCLMAYNTVERSTWGFLLYGARSNIGVYNLFLKNSNYAITCTNSPSNTFHHNSFLQNNGVSNKYSEMRLQVYDDKDSKWYDQNDGGNYYSDMTSPDNDQDGIIDDYYKINGGDEWDRAPLTISPIDLISAPENLEVLNGSNYIQILWDEPQFVLDDNIVGYRIYRASGEGDFRFIMEEYYPKTEYYDYEIGSGQIYYYKVTAYCYLGVGATSEVASGFSDGTGPDISITTPEMDSWSSFRDVYLRWEGTDPESGIIRSSYMLDGGGWIDVGNNTGVLLRDLSQGVHVAYVKSENGVGMTKTIQTNFNVDVTPPEIEINGPSIEYTNSFSHQISWKANDEQSGIDQTKYRMDGGSWHFISSKEYTGIPIHPGENIFEIVAIDKAGLSTSDTKKIIFDGDAPALTIFSPSQESGVYLNSGRMVLEWTCEDVLSGIDRYEITVDSAEKTPLGAHATSHYLILSEGLHEVELKVWDKAGNWEYRHWSVRNDNSTPSVASFYPHGGSISVDVDISVVFSEPMYKSTVSMIIEGVSGRLSWSGNSLIFHPYALLEFGKIYRVVVNGADLSSNYMETFQWEFSTIPSGTLKGRVVGTGNRPLSGAKVSLQNGRSEFTDDQGRFNFELPPGDYTVHIEKSGYGSKEVVLSLSPGQTKDIGNIHLQSEDALSFGVVLAAILVPSILVISLLVLAIFLVVKKRHREMQFYVVEGEEVPRKKIVVEFDEKETSDEFEIIDYKGSPDFYSVLGLDRYASSMEIKKAYRSMAYMYHPDKLQASGLDMSLKEIHVMMRELNEAKETLLDPYKRQAYDISLLEQEI